MLMTKGSKEDGWRAFIELCSHFKKIGELRELFDLFFTLEEKEDVAKRFSILKALLEENLTQREIAEKLGVSISKITRGSNALKIISSHLKEALKKKMA
jgi:TrpR family trp operon transcriptional repressor